MGWRNLLICRYLLKGDASLFLGHRVDGMNIDRMNAILVSFLIRIQS